MANANGAVVQFTPVSTGDMKEIPPDLPAGSWNAQCSVKKAKTARDSFPMLILEWKTLEDLTGDNEDHVGGKSADFVVFYPQNAPASRMSKIRLKGMCTALGIAVPEAMKISSWDDIADFIDELEGLKATIYTTVVTRKDTGETVTKIEYLEPGAKTRAKLAAQDDEEEEDEAPKKKSKAPAAAASKKKNARN